ncbi:hypothetical protein WAI453_001021 [Rhynchosporium graminicola]
MYSGDMKMRSKQSSVERNVASTRLEKDAVQSEGPDEYCGWSLTIFLVALDNSIIATAIPQNHRRLPVNV